MANLIKAAVTAAVAGFGLLVSAPASIADEFDYQFNSIDPSVLDGSGTLVVNDINIQSVSGTFNYQGNSFSFNKVSPGSTFIYEGYIDADFTSGDKFANYDLQLTTSFTSGGKFGNQVLGTLTDHGNEQVSTIGRFYTPIVSVTEPGSSGNAPSPEVNTLVGLLVVTGTFAVMRRRRGGQGSVSA